MRTSDLSKWQVALLYSQGDYEMAERAMITETKYAMVWYVNNFLKHKVYSDEEIYCIIQKKKKARRSK